ncbi:hypothetical protein AJ79_08303 [Helicocarpus griseus UAMH5409]|uniref:EKC/KEOPS complex subunit GON7 n=1 Tax=Helicocarpus griseus UAMH5409 TaxID=1447875 RepID=A0A2B7WU52_9EURO|nr:hypothetical protein AJ79_08303 [Helicocarpus griseus UAMH5409]
MAPPPNTPSTRPSILHATYISPATLEQPSGQTHTFTRPLSSSLSRIPAGTTTASPERASTIAKTAYLSELRGAVTALQGEINEFLTARMEEDNNRSNQAAKSERERREEENYGEEVMDEED